MEHFLLQKSFLVLFIWESFENMLKDHKWTQRKKVTLLNVFSIFFVFICVFAFKTTFCFVFCVCLSRAPDSAHKPLIHTTFSLPVQSLMAWSFGTFAQWGLYGFNVQSKNYLGLTTFKPIIYSFLFLCYFVCLQKSKTNLLLKLCEGFYLTTFLTS